MPCFRQPLEVEMSFLGLITSPFSQCQQTLPPLHKNADIPTPPQPPKHPLTSAPSPVVSMQDEFIVKTKEMGSRPSSPAFLWRGSGRKQVHRFCVLVAFFSEFHNDGAHSVYKRSERIICKAFTPQLA